MKYFLLLVVAFYGNAQKSNQLVLYVQYNETIRHTPKIVNNYEGTLLAQNNLIVYKSDFINTETIGKEDIESDNQIFVDTPENKFCYEVFSNKYDNETTENLFEPIFLKKAYSVAENTPKMKWLLLEGSKKFSKYTCNKAQTTFRGRTYTAWYSTEIPITVGPWKFSGLPGLILKIEDESKTYSWNAKKISYPYKIKNIDLATVYKNRNKYKKVTFKEYDKIYADAIKDKISMIAARNKNREYKSSYSFSTFQNKEPLNEYRNYTEFK